MEFDMIKRKLTGNQSLAEGHDRRGRRKAATRARIVEAALDLLSRQEYNDTTVEQITQAADVGKGTYFNYFESKEHLLGEVGEEQLSKIRKVVEKTDVDSDNLKVVIRELFFSLTGLFADIPILARNLTLANLGNDSARRLMVANVAERVQWLVKLVKKGQKQGSIRQDIKPEFIATWYLQTYFGNLMFCALEPPVMPKGWLQFSFEQFWISVAADTYHIQTKQPSSAKHRAKKR